ncbi:MAG: hypothetical protein LBQ07_00245 [Endomicrobium sp.]|jgi:LPS-assembly protein|nr:hypothetical protein [Endomicrobium sp.]
MNKLIFLKVVIVFVFMFLSCYNIFCDNIFLTADNLEYVENNKISVKGNVFLNFKDAKICSDYAELNINKKIVNIHDNVRIEKNGNLIMAKSILYDYGNNNINLKNIFLYSSYIFLSSEFVKSIEKNKFVIHNIKLSNCDLDKPHTYFKAKHGKFILNKRITIYNAVFYIRKIPIFYFPIITKSLYGHKALWPNLKFEFVNTALVGQSLKTSVFWFLNRNLSCKLKYDFIYNRNNNGHGIELNYTNANVKGNIHLFYLPKNLINKRLYILNSDYFYKNKKGIDIKSKTEFKNNKDFNNLYSQNNLERVNKLESYIAITKYKRRMNLIMDIRHDIIYDNSILRYKKSSIILPRLTLNLLPKNVFMGINSNFFLQFISYYNKQCNFKKDSYYYESTRNLLVKYTLKRALRLYSKIILIPNLEIYGCCFNSEDNLTKFYIKCRKSFDVNVRVLTWMDIYFKYFYKTNMDFKKKCYFINDNLYDVDSSGFILNNYIYIGNKVTLKNGIEYHDDRSFFTNKKCIPFTTELVCTSNNLLVYLKHVQFINPNRLDEFHFYIKIGEYYKTYLNFGVFYQYYDELDNCLKNNKLNNIFGFGVNILNKWRLDYNIKTTIPKNFTHLKINEQELILHRNLHCYNACVKLKRTNFERIFLFKFDLKTNLNRNINNQHY